METERQSYRLLVRQFILIGVIACLCFSVGEGLRLTPFPTSTHTESIVLKRSVGVIIAKQNPLWIHGPLDVPARIQKRDQGQVVDYGSPQILSNREVALYHGRLLSSYKPIPIISSPFGSVTTGRAPPFLS